MEWQDFRRLTYDEYAHLSLLGLASQVDQRSGEATHDADPLCRILRREPCAFSMPNGRTTNSCAVKLSEEEKRHIQVFARHHIKDRFIVWAYHPGALSALS